MIKIKFFSNFCNSDCWKTFLRLNELETDPDYNNKYTFTESEDYTHAIILNTAMPNLSIPKENVIGLAFEPRQFLNLTNSFISYATNNISYYLLSDNSHLPSNFIEHFSYMWHTPYKKSFNILKNTLMSIMISYKNNAPGHKYRHILVQNILKSNLPIDIYGNGCKYYNNINDPRIKGEFNDTSLFDNYKFHICIENFQTPHYFSEKIMDPLICHSSPIYLGCNNINHYFPNMITNLSGNLNDDLKLLTDICNNPDNYIKSLDINKIKDTLNLKNVINKYFFNN